MILSFHHNKADAQASLATEKDYVQSRLAEHGNDLIGMGVDGFRLDSAKRKIRFKQYSFLTGSKYLR